jgi:hypothetical protein
MANSKLKVVSKRKPPKRQRKFTVGILPSEGYWSNGIQKVIRKWRSKIGEEVFDENIESLMIWCHYSVTRSDFIQRKRFAVEIALAVDDVCNRWRAKLGEKVLNSVTEDYITNHLLSITVLDAHIQPVFGSFRRFILELLVAVDDLWNTKSLDHWILNFGFSGDGSDYENGVRCRVATRKYNG